jgi:hypothetical protein
MSYIQPNFNLNLQVAKNLAQDYYNTTDGNLRSSISTVIDYKISTLTSIVTLQNENLISQISTLVLS